MVTDKLVDYLKKIPLTALSLRSQDRLAVYLDPITVLRTSDGPDGLFRDWRGIAHLAGFTSQQELFLSSKINPTTELIKFLVKENHSITFYDFLKMLCQIDRLDALDDTYTNFVADAEKYLKQQERFNRSQQQIVETSICKEISPDCLTMDDVNLAEKNLPLQRYDAFILFADEDADFATEMIEKIEEEFKFKLCVKERDFLGGLSFEHDAIRHLLTERCERLIVILSPHFLCSPLNEYTSNLAQSLGIAQRKRKIIPCVYKQCDLPEIFQHIHLLNYQRSRRFYNFWDKLKMSLKTTPDEWMTNQCRQIAATDPGQTTVNTVASIPNSISNPAIRPEHQHRSNSGQRILFWLRRISRAFSSNRRDLNRTV